MSYDILIVDDCPDDRYLLRRSLERIDDTLVIGDAHSAASGLEALVGRGEKAMPVVVFLDVSMPIRGGFDLLEDVRVMLEEEADRTPPRIVMFSSSRDPRDVARAKQYPFVVDYLEKDADRSTLARTIRRARSAVMPGSSSETIENTALSY